MNNQPTIKVKLFEPGLKVPQYQTRLAAGFDLATAQDAVLPPHQVTRVSTGLAMEIPPEFWLLIAARSSLQKLGLQLANGIGIMDADFCGDNDEIGILLYNFSDQVVEIKTGMRLAQGVLIPRYQAQFQVVQSLDNDDRGGFGSTGQ